MRILVLGDLHLPWVLWDCVYACAEFKKKYKPDLVVQMGDFTDQKAWSRYPKDLEDPTPTMEWLMVEQSVERLKKVFPEMTILEGNHCRRMMYKATEAMLPRQLIKRVDQIFGVETWTFHFDVDPFEADGIAFVHGDEMPGNAWQKAQKLGQSVVQGHDHLGYIQHIRTFNRKTFGMSVGTMVDPKTPAAKYAAKNPMKSFVGWGTITDGEPALHSWRIS